MSQLSRIRRKGNGATSTRLDIGRNDANRGTVHSEMRVLSNEAKYYFARRKAAKILSGREDMRRRKSDTDRFHFNQAIHNIGSSELNRANILSKVGGRTSIKSFARPNFS